MDVVEHKTKERLRREEAADRLRQLADELARHNQVSFTEDGMPMSVRVPDEVELKLEIEVKDDGAEVELELRW